jgi:hypothetical protein
VAPLEERRQEQAGPPVLEEPRIQVARPDAELERPPRRRRAREAAEAADVPLEDTRQSGTDAQPGRTIRVRTKKWRVG